MPGSPSSSTAVARLTLTTLSGCPDRAAATLPRGGGANGVPSSALGGLGTWFPPSAPLKVRCGARVRSSPGPIPGTRSSPSRLPNAPLALRSAAMTFASERPTLGSRASSAGAAMSASTSSPVRAPVLQHVLSRDRRDPSDRGREAEHGLEVRAGGRAARPDRPRQSQEKEQPRRSGGSMGEVRGNAGRW